MSLGRELMSGRIELTRLRARAGALGAAAGMLGALAGCGPESADPSGPPAYDGPERCVAGAIGDATEGARPIALGHGSGASFQAYQDGEEVELVRGFQGGYMVTPSVRVEAAGEPYAEACFQVRLENALIEGEGEGEGEGGEIAPGILSYLMFTRVGEAFYVDGPYDLLGMDPAPLRGKTLALKATVRGEGFEGTGEAFLRLK